MTRKWRLVSTYAAFAVMGSLIGIFVRPAWAFWVGLVVIALTVPIALIWTLLLPAKGEAWFRCLCGRRVVCALDQPLPTCSQCGAQLLRADQGWEPNRLGT